MYLEKNKQQKKNKKKKTTKKNNNTTHNLIPSLVLNVLVYLFEVKKRCKKKSLNKLPLAADSLKAKVLECFIIL